MECVTNFQFATTCTMSIVGPCVNTTLMDGILKYRHQLFGLSELDTVLYFYCEAHRPLLKRERRKETAWNFIAVCLAENNLRVYIEQF